MTSRSTWKGMERKVACILGGRRNPLSGANSGEPGDVRHPEFVVECKLRAKLVLTGWFEKVAQEAKAEGKKPLLVLKEKGKHGEYVVIRLDDFAKLRDGV